MGTQVCCAKMEEPIEMPFGDWREQTDVSSRNSVSEGIYIFRPVGSFGGFCLEWWNHIRMQLEK